MRIEIHDEDDAAGRFLQRILRFDGHDVTLFTDLHALARHPAYQPPDLLLLALVMLRNDAGVTTLRRMRVLYPNAMILTLISHEDGQERARCLDLGADDCMTRPLSCKELVARCRALLRPRMGMVEAMLSFGDLTIDRIARRVTRSGCAVDLTVTEFALLEFLVQRPGQCCTRGQILQHVFQVAPESPTNIVDVYVSQLRKKLSPHGTGPYRSIETRRGTGYLIYDGSENSRIPVQNNFRSVFPDA